MPFNNSREKAFVLEFKEVTIKDVPLVGGKNASLGEMYQDLTKKGVDIPNGFAVTAYAYRYFLEKAGLKDKIKKILSDLDTNSPKNLSVRGKKVRELILKASLPKELEKEIVKYYKKLSAFYKTQNTDVAVRSSATAEDLPNASFAGQQDTYLNVHGEKNLLDSCKKCFASLFTDRAISYRVTNKFDHFKVALSIGVQKMARSDLAASGVMFSLDTESGFRDVVYITSIYGLGENIVQGAVNPDEFYVHKPTLKKGYKSIITKKVGGKNIKMIYSNEKGKFTKNIPVKKEDQNKFAITDEDILKLAKWATIIEDHYKKPMDMEWAKDGKLNKLFLVQARPETVQSRRDFSKLEHYHLKEKGEILVTGKSVSSRIGSGKVKIINDPSKMSSFKKGDVLVTDMTDPDWVPIMKKASAIVTNKGGRTCHAAIVSRELKIPAIVGTDNATKILKDNENVTIDCSSGETGVVYKGKLKFEIKEHNLKKVPKTKTKIMIIAGTPEEAFEQSFIPNEGVGLAREEFIISSYIKIHPNALIEFQKLKNKKLKKEIENITVGYKDKRQFYVDKLAEGVGTIAAAFYPKEVIVRTSDFKTNEYAGLIGGKLYEPKERNPMIGWRGASRYYRKEFIEAFKLECKALKKVRDEFGLKNMKIMIPFCRTPEEGKKVLKIMEDVGLKRGKNGLQIYVMCELPSNILLADEFSKIFDGFSIGSNDLTQLTLGMDRDSGIIAGISNENDPAVKKFVCEIIRSAKKNKKHIGICGQAPSDFPDFAEFLVKEGIDSIALNPDSVIKTTLKISQEEKKLKR